MPTELEEVRQVRRTSLIEPADASQPARRVFASWQYANPSSWSGKQPHNPATIQYSQWLAAEHLVGYSQTDLPLFKRNQLEPVKDLKLLIKDYAPIAKNAFTILINISSDPEVLKSLANDDTWLEALLSRITVCQFSGTYIGLQNRG